MSYSLTLDVPSDLYDPLLKQAEKEGKAPEVVAAEWMRSGMPRSAVQSVLDLAGSLEADSSDLGARHDHYLGKRHDGGLEGHSSA